VFKATWEGVIGEGKKGILRGLTGGPELLDEDLKGGGWGRVTPPSFSVGGGEALLLCGKSYLA